MWLNFDSIFQYSFTACYLNDDDDDDNINNNNNNNDNNSNNNNYMHMADLLRAMADLLCALADLLQSTFVFNLHISASRNHLSGTKERQQDEAGQWIDITSSWNG